MKKLSIALVILAVIYLSMTFFIANIAEKEIKAAFNEQQRSDLRFELIEYQRHFFTANAISRMDVSIEGEDDITLNIVSSISHYPHQAVINSTMQFVDEQLAAKAKRYFGTENWLVSQEQIDIRGQLNGLMTIAEGRYESELESLMTEPVFVSYEMDLNDKTGSVQLDWAGLKAVSEDFSAQVEAVQLVSEVHSPQKTSDFSYLLKVATLSLQEQESLSLVQGLSLKGNSELHEELGTVDTMNELDIELYQVDNDEQQLFSNNRLKFSLAGLSQPAFESLNSGTSDELQLAVALNDLIYHGARLTLSQLSSKTPWGEVEGAFDLTLQRGAALGNIAANPYILFDYMNGYANLALPLALLDEPQFAQLLLMGIDSGFLEQNEQTLNLETSFQQGELVVNGHVLPL